MKKLTSFILLTLAAGYSFAESDSQEPAKDSYFISRFDTNGDNRVTKDEFLALANERFRLMDSDGNKLISLPEFLQRYADFQSARPAGTDSEAPDPEKVFNKLDINKDKQITETEYTTSRNKWFSQLDKDGNNEVQLEETTR